MPRWLLDFAAAAILMGPGWTPAYAAPQDRSDAPDLAKVFVSCDTCDRPRLESRLTFVALWPDQATADVEVSVVAADEPPNRQWTMTFTGRGRYLDQKRAFTFPVPLTATADETATEVERFLMLGLAEYALSTAKGQDLDVRFTRPNAGTSTTAQKDQKDPWNYWIFRVGADAYGSGESSTTNRSLYSNASATRTTENLKVRLSVSRSLDTSSFKIDETETVRTRLTDWSVNALVVKSLGPRWSTAVTSAITASSFSNSKRVVRVMPGVEYDIFPYSESTKRSLTLQYNVGGAHYNFEHETIFDKLSESVAMHSAAAYLGLRQPWGQSGASFVFNQHLTALDRTRVSLNGNIEVRLIRSLSINGSASYSRIRDLFTLEKGEASEEEVLLRQRQLATGYRYSMRIGFSYNFGAVSNTVVNPRFGG